MLDYVLFFGLVGTSFIFYWLHTRRMKGLTEEVVLPPFLEELSKTESPIEKAVYRSLWLRNHQVRCQYPIGRYRLDMALVRLKIAIECDGKAYHSSISQKNHDRRRDAYLKSQGWVTLRFSGKMINRNINKVITRIEKEVQKRSTLVN